MEYVYTFASVHPDCEAHLREAKSFIPTEKYGSLIAVENEIGSLHLVGPRWLRFVTDQKCQPSND